MTTKEKITEEALTLFAEKGYKGTSVKNIADAVGIKDASLYNHFKSKQEIFDSIVELISKHISELSQTLGVPQYDKPDTLASGFFIKLDLDGLKKITRESFTPEMQGQRQSLSILQFICFCPCTVISRNVKKRHLRYLTGR